jgi:archaemetzincin
VQVILQPVASKLDNNTIYHLAKDISIEFKNVKVTAAASIESRTNAKVQFAFDKRRNQWDSFKLLEWILDNFNPTRGIKVLGILDIDAYSGGFDFVFGEAFYRGRVAAIYLSRLRQEFYGLESNPPLFYERLVKEAIHELGHVFGLRHCKNSRCVMHFSTSLLDIDTKRRSFCRDCRKKNFR